MASASFVLFDAISQRGDSGRNLRREKKYIEDALLQIFDE
jgi:hypothetical protein